MKMRTMAFALALTLAQGPVWADVVVTRSITPKAGGCTVELSWEVSGKVESDLIIQETFSEGWSADLDTVTPADSLDAKWASASEPVARFAIKPSLLSSKASISFDVKASAGVSAGTVAGDWRMYLDGALKMGAVSGDAGLADQGSKTHSKPVMGPSGTKTVEMAVTIASMSILGDSGLKLTYKNLPKAGTLVVEGCETLGAGWVKIAERTVSGGDYEIELTSQEVGSRHFMRTKLLTEE